jgi:hypothetical protein
LATRRPAGQAGRERERARHGRKVASRSALGRILVLGTSHDGLFRSEDGARTWTQVATFPKVATSFTLFAPGAAKGRPSPTLFVGTLDKAHPLYISHDGGASFVPVPGGPQGMIAHHGAFDADGHTLYVSFANGPGPNDVTDGALMALDLPSGQWRDISPVKPGPKASPSAMAGSARGHARAR